MDLHYLDWDETTGKIWKVSEKNLLPDFISATPTTTLKVGSSYMHLRYNETAVGYEVFLQIPYLGFSADIPQIYVVQNPTLFHNNC